MLYKVFRKNLLVGIIQLGMSDKRSIINSNTVYNLFMLE